MLDARRKRLWFRCHHCGMAENDVIFGRFAERHLEALSDDQLDRLERLLEENDVDLFKWVTGKAGVQQVVEALTAAELSLQRVTAVRDRVISAYQEIIRMPI